MNIASKTIKKMPGYCIFIEFRSKHVEPCKLRFDKRKLGKPKEQEQCNFAIGL
jgi:hypothetical protein